jgi:hypothetical protein
LHSIEQGLAATRGARTIRDSAISRPACSNSLAPCGSGAEESFIASRRSQVARFQTNSCAAPANVAECFGPWLENASMTGASHTALKKLYGARFTSPSGPVVEIHPTGRGAMIALNGSCGSSSRSRRSGS